MEENRGGGGNSKKIYEAREKNKSKGELQKNLFLGKKWKKKNVCHLHTKQYKTRGYELKGKNQEKENK